MISVCFATTVKRKRKSPGSDSDWVRRKAVKEAECSFKLSQILQMETQFQPEKTGCRLESLGSPVPVLHPISLTGSHLLPLWV
ncbi:hypothetical protein ILYODFUR_038220 [Ilyodon furcidens]|uniref:Uncharacterized protein n=1 Tax=Ilyodon furcidens TaxID=33524 RepID=A0ABV0SVQ2_9TELE